MKPVKPRGPTGPEKRSALSNSQTIVPFDIQVLVTTPKFVICRNVPTDSDESIWYVAQLRSHFTQETFNEVQTFLPDDMECEWVTREGDWWFFDWVVPGGE